MASQPTSDDRLRDDFRRLGIGPSECRVTVIRTAAADRGAALVRDTADADDEVWDVDGISQLTASTYRLLDPRRRSDRLQRVLIGRTSGYNDPTRPAPACFSNQPLDFSLTGELENAQRRVDRPVGIESIVIRTSDSPIIKERSVAWRCAIAACLLATLSIGWSRWRAAGPAEIARVQVPSPTSAVLNQTPPTPRQMLPSKASPLPEPVDIAHAGHDPSEWQRAPGLPQTRSRGPTARKRTDLTWDSKVVESLVQQSRTGVLRRMKSLRDLSRLSTSRWRSFRDQHPATLGQTLTAAYCLGVGYTGRSSWANDWSLLGRRWLNDRIARGGLAECQDIVDAGFSLPLVTAERQRWQQLAEHVDQRVELHDRIARADLSTPQGRLLEARYDCLIRERWASGIKRVEDSMRGRFARSARLERSLVTVDIEAGLEVVENWLRTSERESGRFREAIHRHTLELLARLEPHATHLQQLKIGRVREHIERQLPSARLIHS